MTQGASPRGAQYELTITVRSIKEEHVAYLVRLAAIFGQAFTADGGDREVDYSLERDRDGVERIYEFLPAETADGR